MVLELFYSHCRWIPAQTHRRSGLGLFYCRGLALLGFLENFLGFWDVQMPRIHTFATPQHPSGKYPIVLANVLASFLLYMRFPPVLPPLTFLLPFPLPLFPLSLFLLPFFLPVAYSFSCPSPPLSLSISTISFLFLSPLSWFIENAMVESSGSFNLDSTRIWQKP